VARKGHYCVLTNNCQHFCTAARYLTEPKSIDVRNYMLVLGFFALFFGVAYYVYRSNKTECSDNDPETRANDSQRKKK
jgi:hypothetical protein